MSGARRGSGEDPIFGERVRDALRALAGERDPLRVASVLRERLGGELARRAAALFRVREKAERKFPSDPPLYFTAKGYEQASSQPVARARARRVASVAGGAWVADLTCGIGSDSIALARAGVEVVACDRDLVPASYARANLAAAGCAARVLVAEAERPALRADFVLLDPDRRAGGARSLDPRRWSPSLEAALHVALGSRGACLKLPPSFEPERVDPALLAGAPFRWQWTSWRRELVETCLWTGALAAAAGAGGKDDRDGEIRVASAIDARGHEHVLAGRPVAVEPLGPDELERVRWIAEPDPAVARAGLAGLLAREAGLRPLSERGPFLGGDEAPRSGLLRAWRVLDSAPFDARRVRELLARHDVGAVRVHARGRAEPPEVLERRLRGRGRRRGELVVARVGDRTRALLVEPLVPASGVVGDEGFEPPTSSL